MEQTTAVADTILALERAALDRWGKGDPGGYLDIYAAEATYFDPTLALRVDGREALAAHLRPFAGTFTVDRYEFLHPHVNVAGSTAVLTYNLVNYTRGADLAETVSNRWNVTEVYMRSNGEWRIVHSHFSYTNPEAGN